MRVEAKTSKQKILFLQVNNIFYEQAIWGYPTIFGPLFPCTKQLDLGKSVLIVHVCSKSPELSSFLEIVDRKCLENSRQFY